MSGSPYLEHIAHLEQEIEEHRDQIEAMAAKINGYRRQRDEMKRQLDIALEEMVALRKLTKGLEEENRQSSD